MNFRCDQLSCEKGKDQFFKMCESGIGNRP